MPRYCDNLPQLASRLFLTDGGMGTIGGVVWIGKDGEWPEVDAASPVYLTDLVNTLESPDVLTGHGAPMGGMDHGGMHDPSCSPTWVQPTPDNETLYVACNKSDEILEIDRESWSLTRKFPAGRAPYNLAISADGRILVATLKGGGQVQFFDTEAGESRSIVPSTTTLTHGVTLTPEMESAYPFDETAVYSCMLTDWGPPPDDYWKT